MNTSNQIKLLLNIARHWSRQSPSKGSKGFTLPELLMAMVVAGIVVYAMLSLVISLLGTDQKETAKSQTQVEMSQAMDYIARELQQAVYVYPGDCLGTTTGTDSCPGLSNQIDFAGAGVTPVLAFWKLEGIDDYMADDDSLPNCGSLTGTEQEECYSLLTGLHTYTLVVYSRQQVADDDEIWKGPHLIRRFQLRKYTTVATLEKTDGYSDPGTNFGEWTRDGNSPITITDHPALVDLVDQNDAEFKEDCPANYTETANSISSFYACVSNPSAGAQDAIVYLRGNAAERAGQPGSRSPVYLPSIKRQVKARSVFNYSPPDL